MLSRFFRVSHAICFTVLQDTSGMISTVQKKNNHLEMSSELGEEGLE